MLFSYRHARLIEPREEYWVQIELKIVISVIATLFKICLDNVENLAKLADRA